MVVNLLIVILEHNSLKPVSKPVHPLLYSGGGDDDDDDGEWEDTDDEGESGEEEEEEGDCDSMGGLSYDGDEDGQREFMFMKEETRSRFTEYSLTSSVMRRNEQLTLLDDRFEKVSSTVLQ